MTINAAIATARTAGELIRATEQRLAAAGLFFGHGTDNPLDEAAALVFHVMSLDHAGAEEGYAQEVTETERAQVQKLLEQRIRSRRPLPYLLGEAWFAGLPFYVDERVLIPRSPIAELIAQRFEPWVNADAVRNVLEIGTGSGCIAIAAALALPQTRVTATDISVDALDVARSNVRRYAVADRVELLRADLLDGIEGSYDLIISNPPYVPDDERGILPDEFAHEPALGLFSGADGLDSARRILQAAPQLLSPQGALILEVGAQWQQLEQAFPALPFTWPEFDYGGIGVAVLLAADFNTE